MGHQAHRIAGFRPRSKQSNRRIRNLRHPITQPDQRIRHRSRMIETEHGFQCGLPGVPVGAERCEPKQLNGVIRVPGRKFGDIRRQDPKRPQIPIEADPVVWPDGPHGGGKIRRKLSGSVPTQSDQSLEGVRKGFGLIQPIMRPRQGCPCPKESFQIEDQAVQVGACKKKSESKRDRPKGTMTHPSRSNAPHTIPPCPPT